MSARSPTPTLPPPITIVSLAPSRTDTRNWSVASYTKILPLLPIPIKIPYSVYRSVFPAVTNRITGEPHSHQIISVIEGDQVEEGNGALEDGGKIGEFLGSID